MSKMTRWDAELAAGHANPANLARFQLKTGAWNLSHQHRSTGTAGTAAAAASAATPHHVASRHQNLPLYQRVGNELPAPLPGNVARTILCGSFRNTRSGEFLRSSGNCCNCCRCSEHNLSPREQWLRDAITLSSFLDRATDGLYIASGRDVSAEGPATAYPQSKTAATTGRPLLRGLKEHTCFDMGEDADMQVHVVWSGG
jgi:hypothetical protein